MQLTYSDDALAELVKHPQDRGAVITELFDRLASFWQDDGLNEIRSTSGIITDSGSVLDDVLELGVAGVVLDLRNNPGGLVSSVVDVASQFLSQGLVLFQINADGERTEWKVTGGGKAREVPLVVLVNEGSASASEVFAGAIMDHGRATVIGTTTFGKGSVNNLWPLDDGSGINFTVARWFTPNGTLIEGKGITPDVVVEISEDETEDVQSDQAIELLKELIASGNRGAAAKTGNWIF